MRTTVRSIFAFNEGDGVDVHITDLAYGGAGVGRVEGFVLLVPLALPGEYVRVRITERKPTYARAQVVERHRPSSLAVHPRCGLFGQCGGCQWMNLAYEHQLDAKQRQVVQSLERIGQVDGYTLRRIVRAPDIYHYRNKLELAFSGGAGDLVLGFHSTSPDESVVDVPTCLVGSERMTRVAGWVKEFLEARGYQPAGNGGDRALLRHLVLREGKRTGELLVNLVTNPGHMPDERNFADEITSAFDCVVGVVRSIASTRAGRAGVRERNLSGRACLRERLAGLVYEVAPSTFFQVNTEQAEFLYEKTREIALPRGRQSVLDLYSGVGGLSLVLSAAARRVTAVESSAASVRCAEANARINGIGNVRFIRGEARRVVRRLAEAGKSYDVVTVNPPRSGLHQDVVSTLPLLSPSRIVYVSCNPTTLARDVGGLKSCGYRLAEVVPVDMFPHSYHVETIARLERED
jgi:23S rRNA (uracil1939-C5)-methyltransferase